MKKLLSLILAGAMAAGMTVASFAADEKYDADKMQLKPETTDLEKTEPGTKLKLSISEDLAKAILDDATATKVTEKQLSSAKVSVKKTLVKGSSAIDTIEFKNDKDTGAYVEVKFIKELVATKDVDFDFTVYLTSSKISDVNKKNTEVQLTGTLFNEEVPVADDEEYVEAGVGKYLKADGYNKNVEISAGNDVYAYTKMFNGKKYYVSASAEVKAEDDAVLTKYPAIDSVYTVKQIGLDGATFGFDIDDKYYVYGADGKLLGTTADKVAFSSKYYLSATKIDMNLGSDEEVEEEAEETEEETTPNENNNPETGVNGMVNVAVVAGVVALAAAGAVALKK